MSTTTANTSEVCDELKINSHFGATYFCDYLMKKPWFGTNSRILIAGCGSGHEAVAIAQISGASVSAIDIEDYVAEELRELDLVGFQIGSVCDLPYPDHEFDAVFYYHVIEHVDDPQGSLQEIRRVLKPHGELFVGTPNRSRLLSSVGAYEQSEWSPTIYNKVKDNVRDWKDRILGKFHNHLGAHAGFTKSELEKMLIKHFQTCNWVTKAYLREKYSESRFSSLVQLGTAPGVVNFVAPAIYAWCHGMAKES